MPTEYIHKPWTAPESVQNDAGCVIGANYPLPIVDHKKVSLINLQRIRQVFTRIAKYKFQDNTTHTNNHMGTDVIKKLSIKNESDNKSSILGNEENNKTYIKNLDVPIILPCPAISKPLQLPEFQEPTVREIRGYCKSNHQIGAQIDIRSANKCSAKSVDGPSTSRSKHNNNVKQYKTVLNKLCPSMNTYLIKDTEYSFQSHFNDSNVNSNNTEDGIKENTAWAEQYDGANDNFSKTKMTTNQKFYIIHTANISSYTDQEHTKIFSETIEPIVSHFNENGKNDYFENVSSQPSGSHDNINKLVFNSLDIHRKMDPKCKKENTAFVANTSEQNETSQTSTQVGYIPIPHYDAQDLFINEVINGTINSTNYLDIEHIKKNHH